MLLTLVRHGDAGASLHGLGDAGRCLTLLGRRQARATGRALGQRGVAPSHVWCSPLVRAVQTTELIAAALGFEGVVEARDHLYPDSHGAALVAALAELDPGASVLAVGHMPYMAQVAGELLGAHVGGFSTGAAFHLELEAIAPVRASLAWRWAGRFID